MWRRSESELSVGGEERVVWLVKFAWIRPCIKSQTARSPDAIKIYTPHNYGHSGVPIFTWFWGPRLLPPKVHDVSNTGSTGSVLKTCQVQDEVARSGAEGIVWNWSIVTMRDWESWATTWGESQRHPQMNPIYVSTINSTPRNIKAREEFAMKRGFAARVLSSLFMISFTVMQEFIVLLILISANLWKWKLEDIKMSNFIPLSWRCTHNILTL